MAATAPVSDEARRVAAILFAASDTNHLASGGFDPFWAMLAGAPLLAWSASAFERASDIAEILLVVSPNRLSDAVALAADRGWTRTRAVAATSSRRRDILRLAVDALAPDFAWLVIHDASRPLVTPELIASGLATVEAQQAPTEGAPAVASASIPVNETLKRVQHGFVVETPTRSQLVLLQTPQVFSRAALLASLDRAPADLDPPDAATLAAASGLRVALFPGSPTNIRIATPADLAFAEALLNPR
jgi:2-C-methyl-D-erythritol 4-phosphate cytidylyltransferase